MAGMTDEQKKYPRTLSAPVTDEMWSWFKDQADAEYRSPGAHLRWLIDKYKADTETRLDLIDRFAPAVSSNIPVVHHDPHEDPVFRLQLPVQLPDDEGMT